MARRMVEIPENLHINDRAPARIMPAGSRLDRPVTPDGGGAEPRHRLVTVGDSLAQGFKSLAIHDTGLSWPAIVAHELGIGATFRVPDYPGPPRCPGLPLNIEAMVRRLDEVLPGRSEALRLPAMGVTAYRLMNDVERYWERGEGSKPPADGPRHHNLAVYGADLRDACEKSIGWCQDQIDADRRAAKDDLLHQLVSHDTERATIRALWGAGNDPRTTQLGAAEALGRDGGIETLVVMLGSNNALRTVIDLKIVWSGDDYADLGAKSAYTLWRPEHFAADLREVVARLRRIDARNVILATVPHITIPPITRGVGDKPYYSRYFTRYTRPWISDEAFEADRDPCLTGDEARVIDSTVDAYNAMIIDAVADARDDGRNWLVLDLCGLLDSLAYRRYLASPGAQPDDFVPYELPPALRALSPRPDTRFLGADTLGRTQGGLISLDGVHPTTIGYGILAQEAIRVMQVAGVRFPTAAADVDFARLVAADTLISDPSPSLTGGLRLIGWLDEAADLIGALRGT